MRLVVPAAGAGVVAGVALAVVASRHADVTTSSPLRPPAPWSGLWTGGLIGSFVLYAVGLAALARAPVRLPVVLALAAAVQLVPLAAPLLLSKDAYSYWDYARVGAVHDGNPYADRPSRWPDDPAYRRIGADWREKRSVYGPAFTLGSELDSGDSARTATLSFRIAAAVAALALAPLCAAAAGGSAFAAAFAGWNPLFAIHFAGAGHNDVLMAAFLLAALALGRMRRVQLAGIAWVLSLGVKIVPLVFLPLRVLEARANRRRVGHLGFAAAAAAGAAVATWRYGFAWLTIFSPVANQLRQTSSLGLPYWLGRLGVPERIARDGLALAFVLVYLWLLREAWRGRARLALCAGALILATSWLQPWYAVWAVPLAAIEDDLAARLLALALTAYLLSDAIPR